MSEPLYTIEFERFWAAYPRKFDKARAARAYDRARRRAEPEEILAGVSRYVADLGDSPQREVKYAQRWLDGERWLDEGEETR